MELTNEELASIGENGWQADADTVRALIWEIRVLRAGDEKMIPSLHAIQAYLKKYEVGLGSGGQQVTQILLDDAEHLRAELERQREEIAALRGALQSAQALIKEGVRKPGDVDYAEYVESYERAMGVRPDAPAEAVEPWTYNLGIGDVVLARIVFQTTPQSADGVCVVAIENIAGILSVKSDQVNAPAPQPAPAREIGTPDLTDDELEIAKAEMDAFYGRTDDDEPDYEAYRAAQEKAHWDTLDQMDDARELDEYFEEHGVEPGGACPDCGRTDTGCTCK